MANANQQYAANMNNQNMGNMMSMANANNQYGSNMYNNNANQYAAMQNANQQYQQSLLASLMGANVSGLGNQVSQAQSIDQQNYNQGWGNTGNALGIAGSLLSAFSDEELKHYRECSKKVVVRSPSKIQSLKFVKQEK